MSINQSFSTLRTSDENVGDISAVLLRILRVLHRWKRRLRSPTFADRGQPFSTFTPFLRLKSVIIERKNSLWRKLSPPGKFYATPKECTIISCLQMTDTGAVSGFLPGGGRDIFRGWRKSSRGWRKKFSGTSFPSAFFCFPTHYITKLRPLFFLNFRLML